MASDSRNGGDVTQPAADSDADAVAQLRWYAFNAATSARRSDSSTCSVMVFMRPPRAEQDGQDKKRNQLNPARSAARLPKTRDTRTAGKSKRRRP